MKPEPLKGKLWNVTEERLGDTLDVDTVASEDDICSAVEWLKFEVLHKDIREFTLDPVERCKVCRLIDHAFEDVVKESQKGD
jgi:hypothetical protein